ncbi:MAG: hypothetical protein JO151_09925 [Verrucomicrobia bacterium]|nr:hypothetical protein [Verrucomicrobiota bacterium]
MNLKSVQDSAVLGHYAKSDIRYWQQSIFRQTYTRNGRTLVTKDRAMKIAHNGRQETFPLGTPNRAAGAARARDIYLSLLVDGWDVTLARFKKPGAAKRVLNVGRSCTVGEFLQMCFDFFRRTNLAKQIGETQDQYARAGRPGWMRNVARTCELWFETPER